jgi:hypothetical protein
MTASTPRARFFSDFARRVINETEVTFPGWKALAWTMDGSFNLAAEFPN